MDWLDEAQPGSFRQAQISFSSRIPGSFPVGDAMTMSTNLVLYANHGGGATDAKAALKVRDAAAAAGEGMKFSGGGGHCAQKLATRGW